VIRAVVDTGVLIAGLISSSGSPADVLTAVRDGRFDLVACPMLLAELRRALSYPKLTRYVSEAEADAFVSWIARVAVVLADPSEIPSVTRDPNDDYLFALALDAGATCIVSGDADLTVLREPPVRVLTPRDFVATLAKR
jgi:putative PIN family toxin of toxin-antitoxin system